MSGTSFDRVRFMVQLDAWRLRRSGQEKLTWAQARIRLASALLAGGGAKAAKPLYDAALRQLDEALGHMGLDNSVYEVLSVAPDTHQLVQLYNKLADSGFLTQWQKTLKTNS